MEYTTRAEITYYYYTKYSVRLYIFDTTLFLYTTRQPLPAAP